MKASRLQQSFPFMPDGDLFSPPPIVDAPESPTTVVSQCSEGQRDIHLFVPVPAARPMTPCRLRVPPGEPGTTRRAIAVTCERCRKSKAFERLTRVTAATASASTLLLPDGTRVADLELPERLLIISLWGRWADLVAEGIKTLETREREWPYVAGWLGIHAAQRHDGKLQGVELAKKIPDLARGPRGAVTALVWIAGSRRLDRKDLPKALVYGPGRWAWEITRRYKLVRPIEMRGPQNFASVERARVEAALAA